ncbi:MAG: CDP-alcohol phosphatidyltransferase [Acidobacteria bacterium]|nr:CDP-alcohol phosphatidyltransferase [Acidobacteriota bacterium]
MTMTPNQSSPRYSKSRRHRALAELAVGLVPLALVTTGITRWFGLPNSYVLLAFLSYLVIAGLVISWLPSQDWPGLGAGNRVTAGRGTLVASLAALIPYPQILFDEGYWWIIGLATVALCLDGLDGLLARKTGTTTAFGARFDMELDSFLMLVLATLVWQSGRVEPWILAMGLPRYGFVAAGWLWHWLRAPLPPRLRRKTGCVAQGVALLVCLGPVIPPFVASTWAAATLCFLLASFAVDIVWLFRRR